MILKEARTPVLIGNYQVGGMGFELKFTANAHVIFTVFAHVPKWNTKKSFPINPS